VSQHVVRRLFLGAYDKIPRCRTNTAFRSLAERRIHAAAGSTRRNLSDVVFLVALALLGLAAAGSAHQLSDSYLILQVTNSEIIGHWDIALKDLLQARGLDSLDQKFTDLRSFDAEREMTNAHVLSALKIKIDGAPVEIKPLDYSREIYNEGPYAAVYFEIPLPATGGRTLEVEYRLFFGGDNVHRGLMRLQVGARAISAIFSPAQPIQRFDLQVSSGPRNLLDFVREGVDHIWTGVDHILFLLALLFPSVLRWQGGQWEVSASFRATLISVLKIVTAFTLAHSITLSLAALKIVHLNSRLVEVTIARSVAFAALNNIFAFFPDSGWLIAFGFGFIHGFGFANALSDLGLEHGNLAAPLVGFNCGVELGQLAIVAVFLPLAFSLRSYRFYRVGVFKFGSLLITALAAIWASERAFDLKWLPF